MSRLGALQERQFRLLWLGQTASAFGDSLIYVALPFAVIQAGGGAAELGLVLAAFTLARAGFIVVGGVWADRLPRRLVMLACDVIRAAVQAAVAVALLTGSMEIWMFVVTSTLFGAAQAFFAPASTGLVPETISDARLQEANALLKVSEGAATIAGPAFAGVLVAVFEPGVVYAIDSLTFMASAVFLARLRLKPREPSPRQRFVADLLDGAREAWSHMWLRAGFLAAAVANVGIGIMIVLGPLIAAEELGGAAAWGLILTGGAIGGLLGGVLALRFSPSRPVPLALIVWSFGSLPLLALVPPLPALAIATANAVFAFGIVLGNTIWETLQQREIPAERLSRVNSFDWMVSLIFMPVGQALAGPLAEAVGFEPVLIGAALLIAVPCFAVLPLAGVWRGPTLAPSGVSGSAGESPVPVPPGPLP
ncbi:MAG TPA: MFS transporter [Gaiellaceae bacterium]|nr:MFS transporter [Gaiellaceae bacterium]